MSSRKVNNNNKGKKVAQKPKKQVRNPNPKPTPRRGGVPIASSNNQVSRPARTLYTKSGMRQVKSELLFTLPDSNTSAFHVVKRIRINPLSRETFKWLPSLAKNYESFKFHSLRIRYENRCSTVTGGSIIMSPSYDAADSDSQATSEALIYENKGTVDFSVWKSGSLNLSVASMNRLYKNHTCMSDERFKNTKQDLKTIDPCQVFICLDGVIGVGGTAATTGKVFLDYDVEFFEPHPPTEEPYSDGAVGSYTLNDLNVTRNSTKPLVSGAIAGFLTQNGVSEPVIDKSFMPHGGTTLPTASLYKFARDWEGIINTTLSGTGFTTLNGNAGKYYVGTNPTSEAGTGDDRLLGDIGSISLSNAGGTQASAARYAKILAGEYLKWKSPDFGNINSIFNQFSGTSII